MVALQNRYRAVNSSNSGENDNPSSRESMSRRRESTSPDRAVLSIPETPPRGQSRSPEPIIRVSLQPQEYQPQPSIHYTYSQGAFSQGMMSRASSEAIFHTSSDPDDESESCLYFMGGEVVIRRGDNSTSHGSSRGGDPAINYSAPSVHSSVHSQMNRYDSTSTLQSAVAHLGTISDETTASGLQAIYDLTPRLCNLSRLGASESPSSGAPVFPVLDSVSPRSRQRHTQNTD